MDYWNIKDWLSYHIIQRVDIKPWKTQKTKSGIVTTAFKKELPDIAARFLKTSTSRRFCVN